MISFICYCVGCLLRPIYMNTKLLDDYVIRLHNILFFRKRYDSFWYNRPSLYMFRIHCISELYEGICG